MGKGSSTEANKGNEGGIRRVIQRKWLISRIYEPDFHAKVLPDGHQDTNWHKYGKIGKRRIMSD